MSQALDEVGRVGSLVGGATAKRFARELREVIAKLDEGASHGPRGLLWPREAMRLKLAADISEHAHNRRAADGLDGRATLKLEMLSDVLDGKAMAGMDRHTERRFCFFIEALGGGPADGRGHLGSEALDADERTFNRAAELWYGEAEAATETERRELARWRGESP